MSCRRVLPAACMLASAALATASAADRGQFIVSVDVAELVRRTVGEGLVASVRSGSPTGVSYRLLAGEKHAGHIIVGVFAGKDEARAGLERRLGTMSLEPVLRSDIEFGDVGAVWGSVGDAQPDRYIAFSRDNAVVLLASPHDRAVEAARAIDRALITGTNGVRRSERIHLPRIVGIEIPDHLPSREVVPVKVRVAVPERACRDRLSFVDRSGAERRGNGYPITDMQGEVEMTRVAHYHVPHAGPQMKKHAVRVCYATAGCVVVSKKVTIPATAGPAAQGAKERGNLVVGIDAEELVRGVLGEGTTMSRATVGRRGVMYSLMKEGHRLGTVVIGVLGSDEAALRVFQDHIMYTSVGGVLDLSGKVYQRAARWKGRILFLRDNAVVSLWLPQETLEATAKLIDQSLTSGASGVRRGSSVLVPRIIDVQAPEHARKGEKMFIKVRVAVPDGSLGDRLGCADRYGVQAGGLPFADPNGEVEIVRRLSCGVPRAARGPREKSFWVCYATAECVMASKKVTVALPAVHD